MNLPKRLLATVKSSDVGNPFWTKGVAVPDCQGISGAKADFKAKRSNRLINVGWS